MNAYDKALSLLAVREHTEKEIRTKLNSKGYENGEIESAISKLKKEGSLSHERFAEVFVRSRVRKGDSAEMIKLKLIDRGIDKSQAKEAANEIKEMDEYLLMIKKSYEALSDKKGDEKALQSLLRKGFSLSEIKKALSFGTDMT